MNSQHNDKCQETDHHDLGDTLNSILKPQRTDSKCKQNCRDHPASHSSCGSHQIREKTAYLIRRRTAQLTGCHNITIVHHPACHHRIKHHQHVIADHSHITVFMKIRTLRFQFMKCSRRTQSAAAPYCKFTHKDRQPKQHKKNKINKDKCSTAILTCHIWKFPYVSKTYRASG